MVSDLGRSPAEFAWYILPSETLVMRSPAPGAAEKNIRFASSGRNPWQGWPSLFEMHSTTICCKTRWSGASSQLCRLLISRLRMRRKKVMMIGDGGRPRTIETGFMAGARDEGSDWLPPLGSLQVCRTVLPRATERIPGRRNVTFLSSSLPCPCRRNVDLCNAAGRPAQAWPKR